MADCIYPCLPSNEIASLPVSDLADKHAALLLWSTWAHLPEALRVIEAWGFQYKTCIPWVKMQAQGIPRRGFGFHAANCSEPLLIATRGGGMAPGPSRIGIMFHPASSHSIKPEDQYELAERYPGPYLELFHRPRHGLFPPRHNWTFLGNEVTGNDIRDDLLALAQEVLPLSNP